MPEGELGVTSKCELRRMPANIVMFRGFVGFCIGNPVVMLWATSADRPYLQSLAQALKPKALNSKPSSRIGSTSTFRRSAGKRTA